MDPSDCQKKINLPKPKILVHLCIPGVTIGPHWCDQRGRNEIVICIKKFPKKSEKTRALARWP